MSRKNENIQPTSGHADVFTYDRCLNYCIYYNTVIVSVSASVHIRRTEKQPAQHLVWDQGAKHICPVVSRGPQLEANNGFPRGSVWLGDIWLSLVLCNPQPSPSAQRPRCVEPASLLPNPAPLLYHS